MSGDKMDTNFGPVIIPSDLADCDAAQSTVPIGNTALHHQRPGTRGAKRLFSLEWAAGFMDGEGCICIVTQRYKDPSRSSTYRLTFSISQNDRQVLEHFQKGMGIPGGLFDVGRLVQHNKQVYTLNYTGANALKVIATLQPHLVRKQLEAQTAMAYWVQGQCGRHPGPKGWPPAVMAIRERFKQKLRSLK